MPDGTVLVVGASGSVGREVLDALRRREVPVRALSRNPQTVRRWQQDGIDAAVGAPGELKQALQGCQRMFLLSAATANQYADDRLAIDAARAAGLSHVVKLSSGDAVANSPIAWARSHAYSDQYLQETELSWTILKPSAFFPNLLSNAATIRRGFLPHTSGAGAPAWVDVADIAQCAAAVFCDEQHFGATYQITGPEALSYPQLALRFSSVLARTIRPVFLPAPLYRAALRTAGVDAWTASNLVAQFADVVRSGHDDPGVSDAVHHLTGHPPTSVVDWIWQQRETFSN